jgi:hypothetical protein
MKMKVIVDSQADFDKWIKEQPALTAKGTQTNSAHSFLNKENPLASN